MRIFTIATAALAVALLASASGGPAEAAQVCIQRSTGQLRAYQSDARPGTCTRNLIAAGIPASDIEEREVTPSEWAQLKETHFDAPARARARAHRLLRQSARGKLEALGLTTEELRALFGGE